MNKYIAVDFDGTVCEHKFPEIGNEVPHAINSLKELQKAGYKLILNTMRSNERALFDKNGKPQRTNPLTEAAQWLFDRGIDLYGINKNPTQDSWTSSPKVYANFYIDDAAIGCPLIYPPNNERPYVDWLKIMDIIKARENSESGH